MDDYFKNSRDDISDMFDKCCKEQEVKRMTNMYADANDVVVLIGGRAYRPRCSECTQTVGEYPVLQLEVVMSPRNRCSYVIHKDDIAKTKTPTITNVIFNPPATIVFWSDKTKTVVKCDYEYETYDPEKGIAMSIAKKMMGDNKYEYYNTFLHWMKKWEKQKKEILNAE